MKRLLALLLALLMVATLLVACNDDTETPDDGDTPPCTTHADTNNDGKCDTCGADMPDKPDTGLTMMQAVTAQLEAAKSMKLSFVLDRAIRDGIIDFDDDGDYEHNITYLDVLISRTQNGTDLRVDCKSVSRDEDGTEHAAGSFTPFYLVNNVLYVYVTEPNAGGESVSGYRALPLNADFSSLPSASALLLSLCGKALDAMDSISFTEAQQKEIGNALIDLLAIADGKGGAKLDLKPYYDSFETYVTTLDPATKTVEALINDVLALVSKDLTVTALLDKLVEVGSLTAWEAMQKIDAWLAEEYETSLQAIYDKLAATDTFRSLLAIYVAPESDVYQEILSFRLAEVKDSPFGSTTLYDLVMSLMSAILVRPEAPAPEEPEIEPYTEDTDTENTYPSIEELVANIKEKLTLTLAQLAEMSEIAADVLDYAEDWCDSMTLNECYLSADVAFKGAFLVDTLTLNAVFDAKWVDRGFIGSGSEGGEPDTTEWTQTGLYRFVVSLAISDISTETVKISAPTNVIS